MHSDEVNEEDRELFLKEMQGVERLSGSDRVTPWRARLKPFPLDHCVYEAKEEERDLYSEHEIKTGDELGYSRPGLQTRVFQDLRRGKIPVEFELDLHGLTSKYARVTLDDFLQECMRRRIRCARIIHGKGLGSEDRQPVLKQKVDLWLRQRDDVLAFCSATSRDGGTGAAYVLLRSSDKKKKDKKKARKR